VVLFIFFFMFCLFSLFHYCLHVVKLLVIPCFFSVVLLGACLCFWFVYLFLVFLLFIIERCSISVVIARAARAVHLGVGAISLG
jgi:hypothetical protein